MPTLYRPYRDFENPDVLLMLEIFNPSRDYNYLRLISPILVCPVRDIIPIKNNPEISKSPRGTK